MCFPLLSIKYSAARSSFQPLLNVWYNQIVEHSSDNKTVLSSGHKLGEATKHLIGSNEKRICWLSFEFKSLHVTERHSNICVDTVIINFIFFFRGTKIVLKGNNSAHLFDLEDLARKAHIPYYLVHDAGKTQVHLYSL